jgi:hypothetical protein
VRQASLFSDEINHTVEARFSLSFLLHEGGIIVHLVGDHSFWPSGVAELGKQTVSEERKSIRFSPEGLECSAESSTSAGLQMFGTILRALLPGLENGVLGNRPFSLAVQEPPQSRAS